MVSNWLQTVNYRLLSKRSLKVFLDVYWMLFYIIYWSVVPTTMFHRLL